MAMWIATFESRNFSFMAMGRSREHAKDALLDGLTAHGKQYGCERDWWCWSGWQDEVAYVRMKPGECLRDSEAIVAHGSGAKYYAAADMG